MTATPDPAFSDPRLAATYDLFEGERDDLDHYERMVDEFDIAVVLDVGCGTGELACRLARRGIDVIGVDPARASVDIARSKPGADSVRWIVGTTADVSAGAADLATMTGNVAQVFLTDEAWRSTLRDIARSLRPGGVFIFETRDPERRAWERWTPDQLRASAELPDGDRATTWCTLTAVDLPLVSFRFTTVFESDGAELVSDSTLRFRTRPEIERSLAGAGFDVLEVRDPPDRPGLEWVFVARRRR
jgi:SAM-dependent methyltransferase